MIIASVRFQMRPGTTLQEVAKIFELSAPKYRKVPGLITKHYVFGNGQGGGIYLWDSRELAEQLFTPEWKAKITERYGAAPQIEWLDNPVTVDNVTGRVVVDAREGATDTGTTQPRQSAEVRS